MVEKVKYRNYNSLVILRSNAKLLFMIKKMLYNSIILEERWIEEKD